MKAITLCLWTTWTALLMVHELLADGDVSLCSEEGIFPRTDHCRLLILCLKSKTHSSQWKEYLLSCPYGYNFNNFMMSCYDFQQECALEEGSAVNKKLAKAWSLTLPNEPESCKGAKAPFCIDEEILTICHPFSKKVLGYVNCKEKDATHSYCDPDEGKCKKRTSSTTTTQKNDVMVPEQPTDGDDSLCSEEGIFPRSEHCRLLIICLKSKTQSSQWKQYLLNCPYGYNFNHFMMSCYDFQQDCALEKGSAVNKKLAKSWSLILPDESETCNGAKAPFCMDEEMLTICHPFSKKVLGYVNCKEKDATRSYCDQDEGICKRRTSSTATTTTTATTATTTTTDRNNANGVTDGTTGANYLRVVVLCSASLKEAEAKRCVELFGREYECLASEDQCPVYIAELINIGEGGMLQSIEASINIYASMGNMNVQTIVGRPTNESITHNQNDGDIISGAMKLQKCQNPGGNCLSDGDTLMDCFDSLRIKHAYRCSDIYGNLVQCNPQVQDCVKLQESGFMFQGRSDSFRRTKGGGAHSSGPKDGRRRPGKH